MFVGLFGDKLLLRLSYVDSVEIFKTHPDSEFFESMPERAMKGYVALPRSVYSNDAEFEKFLNKSIEYVSSLPPKKTKAKKKSDYSPICRDNPKILKKIYVEIAPI